jgi:murein L,D-transpeptidase YcbB/YkuD
MELQNKLWQNNERLKQAAFTAFRSMQKGRDKGTLAVFKLQQGIDFMNGRAAPDGSGLFGPFASDLGGEHTFEEGEKFFRNCFFGPNTEAAVRAIQAKLGLNVDGKAGIETLPAMDLVLLTRRESFNDE